MPMFTSRLEMPLDLRRIMTRTRHSFSRFRKHWWVYEPSLTLPHRSQPFTPQGYTPPAPLLEADLHPGDLLYLPRGYVHATRTSESFSAHLTIGITVYTWIELAAELLQACKTMPAFRKALPPGFASQEALKTTLKAELVRLMDASETETDYDRLLQGFSDKVKAARFETGGTFRSDVVLAGPRTVLRVTGPVVRLLLHLGNSRSG